MAVQEQQDGTYVRWFKTLGMNDVPLVGGKNASLGEMYRELTPLGVRIPNGFAVQIQAYKEALSEENLKEMHSLLDPLYNSKHKDVTAVAAAGLRCREIVYNAGVPKAAEQEILQGFRALQKEYGEDISVAVRSSATAEDLPTASFAGQHDTYLHVKGEESLIQAVRKCQASLFTDRAISYRMDKGFDHFKVFLSCGIMLMVRSDLAASGVMFSIDTETGYRDAVFITGAYGLGENVVQGTVDPDEILVHKPTYELGFDKVPLRRVIGRKQVKMVYTHGRGAREPVKNIPTPHEDRERLCITDAQAMELAGAAIKIEKHYSAVHGKLTPMDMEWALDGLDGKIYLVQARPETVASQQAKNILERYTIRGKGKILTTGRAVGTKIVTGRARIIRDASELSEFQEGEILVSDTTTPDWEPVMKRSAAIITNRGGRTCHASIISRELGIAATVGCTTATKDIKTGQMITVSCGEGDTGKVYEGEIPFDLDRIDLGKVQKPKTDMMVNIGNPEKAFETSLLPAAGVGLARMEFILNKMKVHPMALVHPERLTDEEEREEIAQLIHNFKDGPDYFVRTLAEGVGTICAAFYPRPVVIRMSDFKSNEYSQLLGGAVFEPKEENPMIGFRGASRYVHPAYQEGFELECRAIKFVRETMGLTNLTPMIPFCRTITEAKKVLEVMEKCGLKRGVDGLKMYVMCEIPNNVISIDEFSKLFDGFSIGSNDLTQLTLGCDRDSDLVANDFDERDPGVLKMLELAVQGCKRNGRHSGICGQAPSDYPEIAEYLVKLGIDSISLIPDTLIKTMVAINDLETKMSK